MYEKLTDGSFFEVGGTSTDISCVKDGKVMIRYAEVGGHKTYLNSLDVRTVGIGGGSMVEIRNGKAVNTGPPQRPHRRPGIRGVHPGGQDRGAPAGVGAAYGGRPGVRLHRVRERRAGGADHGGRRQSGGLCTRGGLRLRQRGGGPQSLEALADNMGCTVEEAARKVLDFAAAKNSKVASQLIKDYEMDPRHTVFVAAAAARPPWCPTWPRPWSQILHRTERPGHLHYRRGAGHGAGHGGAQCDQPHRRGHHQRAPRGGAQGHPERRGSRHGGGQRGGGHPAQHRAGPSRWAPPRCAARTA